MSSAELFENIFALMDKMNEFYDNGEMSHAAYNSLWNAVEAYDAKCAEEHADKEEE